MIVYTVTKIFGVDCVKNRVFYKKPDAEEHVYEIIDMLVDNRSDVEIFENENEETYYIINRSEDPENFIEIILRRNEIK